MVRSPAETLPGPERSLAVDESDRASEVGSVASDGQRRAAGARVRVTDSSGDPHFTAPDSYGPVEEIEPPAPGTGGRIRSPYRGTDDKWEMAYCEHDQEWC